MSFRVKLASRRETLQEGDMARICILTPDESAGERWEAEAAPIRAALGARRISFRRWTSAGDLSKFALIMPLIAWGYHLDVPRWYRALEEWETEGLPFANPVQTLRWNSGKHYLLDLEVKGVAVVPTIISHELRPEELEQARETFGAGELIIKPSISAGSAGTYRLGPGAAIPFDVLRREMLIQPVMDAIMDEGEYSLFYFGGQYSHAVLKRPVEGDFRVQPQFGGRVVSVDPPAQARALAEEAIAAAPSALLYARVDMVRDGEGGFRLMELELIEPALFLDQAADAGKMFGDAVLARLG
jgi:glutathione synthase/RimK-type ligase-like ATP-grasp enzyme